MKNGQHYICEGEVIHKAFEIWVRHCRGLDVV